MRKNPRTILGGRGAGSDASPRAPGPPIGRPTQSAERPNLQGLLVDAQTLRKKRLNQAVVRYFSSSIDLAVARIVASVVRIDPALARVALAVSRAGLSVVRERAILLRIDLALSRRCGAHDSNRSCNSRDCSLGAPRRRLGRQTRSAGPVGIHFNKPEPPWQKCDRSSRRTEPFSTKARSGAPRGLCQR